jgi:prepilin-type N-terminal cleavage/methylation domain-containing protein
MHIRRRDGFTLIEIVVVVVVMGVLAGVAIPRYQASKDQAHIAAMKADLHNAANLEEQYASENSGKYFSGVATANDPLNGFRPSEKITVTFTAFSADAISGDQYYVTVRHSQSPKSCEMRNGVITCTTDNALTTGFIH